MYIADTLVFFNFDKFITPSEERQESNYQSNNRLIKYSMMPNIIIVKTGREAGEQYAITNIISKNPKMCVQNDRIYDMCDECEGPAEKDRRSIQIKRQRRNIPNCKNSNR